MKLHKKLQHEALYKKCLAVALATLIGISPIHAATLNSINQNNTISVPLKTISEAFGASVQFDQGSKKITILRNNQVIELIIGSKEALVNGNKMTLQVAPQAQDGITYVPVRFISEALGAEVDYKDNKLTVTLDGISNKWELVSKRTNQISTIYNATTTFKNISKTVNGKKVTAISINLNDPKVKVNIATAGGKITQAAAIKNMASGAKVSINGTYFAAYNGDVPMPDGTLVKNGKVLHITDIGSTIGFTSDNKVLIDFVKTRVQGYVNGVETWMSYRVNRHTPDSSATVLYTPEYDKNITLPNGWIGVVCMDGKVVKYATNPRTVPANGFILTMRSDKKDKYPIGASVTYKTTYQTTHTSAQDWEKVTHALSAGPSLMINGQLTGDPAQESFTEAKILTQAAQRSFIGVNAKNELVIGTVSANVNDLKKIVKAMGLTKAMCLDGGASSGLYYNGSYLTSPGRNVNNCITFSYN